MLSFLLSLLAPHSLPPLSLRSSIRVRPFPLAGQVSQDAQGHSLPRHRRRRRRRRRRARRRGRGLRCVHGGSPCVGLCQCRAAVRHVARRRADAPALLPGSGASGVLTWVSLIPRRCDILTTTLIRACIARAGSDLDSDRARSAGTGVSTSWRDLSRLHPMIAKSISRDSSRGD